MAIQSVSSSIGAYQPSGTQLQQAQQNQQSQQTQSSQTSEVKEPTEPRPQQRVERQEESQPKPVVNAQGQPTGTLINVVA